MLTSTGAEPDLPDPDPITQALACYDAAYSNRRTAGRESPTIRPKFKPLVLQVVPNAHVRRIATSYECFIGSERISGKGCCGEHSTPDKAWVCLARFIAARGHITTITTGAAR